MTESEMASIWSAQPKGQRRRSCAGCGICKFGVGFVARLLSRAVRASARIVMAIRYWITCVAWIRIDCGTVSPRA